MPKQTSTKTKEKSQTTKPATKNTKTSTTKSTAKSSKTKPSQQTSKQTKNTTKSSTKSNNKQHWIEDDIESDEYVDVVEWMKMHALMNKYRKYATSPKGKAARFVKRHIKKANNKVWIDIIKIEAPKYYEVGYMQFKTVICELYPRTIQPEYPPRSQYSDKADYKMICKALDWETAQKDIRNQKRNGEEGVRYKIEGVMMLNDKPRPPMFSSEAPDYIKALANDINDKSSSAWEDAYKYLNPAWMDYDEFVYKIKKIEKI